MCSRIGTRQISHIFKIQTEKENLPTMDAISHLVNIKATEQVPDCKVSSWVYSIFFPVPKRNKDCRANLDLKYLMGHKHVRMKICRSVMEVLYHKIYGFHTLHHGIAPHCHSSISSKYSQGLLTTGFTISSKTYPLDIPRMFSRVMVTLAVFLHHLESMFIYSWTTG